MKVYELIIDENEEESGVLEIALVDMPAIESNWQAFNKSFQKFKIHDEEKRIVSGWAMKADLPIARIGEDGEQFQVIFRKPTIEKIVHKYMREARNNAFNIMHTQTEANGVYLIESIIKDSDRGMKAPATHEDAPDGSWFISAKVDNDEIWNEIKQGTWAGFSVEGFFGQTKAVEVADDKIAELQDLIKNYARAYAKSMEA